MRPEGKASPARLVTTLAGCIVGAEVAAMAILTILPPLPYWAETALDAILLSAMAGPALHYMVYRPLEQAYAALERSGRELERSRMEFRHIVERNPDGALILDAGGLVRYANPAACSLLGRAPGELVGSLMGLPLGGETELEGRWLEVAASKTEWEGRDATLVSLRDITESRRLRERLLQSEKLSAGGSLAAGVAHEINNPLGVILGFAQVLADRMRQEDAFWGPIKAIEREALRCKSLVQDLLLFSRQGKEEAEEFDFDSAVAHALALVKARAGVQGVTLAHEAGAAGNFRGGYIRLQEVVVNLAVNAIDAMPQGGSLKVRTWRTGVNGDSRIFLRMEDSGTGIPAAVIPKIFEPFFTTKGPGKGTGLGLALVHEIVTKHGGTIEVDSIPGQGTAFTVALPVAAGAGVSPE